MPILTSLQSRASWQVVVRPDLAAMAGTVARDIASRLRETTLLQKAADQAIQQTWYPHLIQNTAYTITGGNAGLALLCSAFDRAFSGEGWDVVAHQHLQIAIHALECLPASRSQFSLSSGLSGLLFVASLLSRDGTRYQRLLSALEQQALPGIRALAQKVTLEQPHGCAETLYDLISGLAGMGIALLNRRVVPQVAETLQAVIEALIYLTEESEGIPHWHVPARLVDDRRWTEVYPDGYLNCGLAHGIPGPLAFLSLARCEGITVPGLDAAITRAADWLVAHHIQDEWGINWPTACPLRRFTPPADFLQSSRTAWCYGTPGIARALWLAGMAVDCVAYRDIALAGMHAVYRQPLSVRRIDSPGFCHGIAGLLHITLRFANEIGDAPICDAASTVCEQLLSLYQPELLLGYHAVESQGVLVDHPWFLDGAIGIALVLLAASTPEDPGWDRFFLLS